MHLSSDRIFTKDSIEGLRANLQADLNTANKAKLRSSLLSRGNLARSKKPLDIGKDTMTGARAHPTAPRQGGAKAGGSETTTTVPCDVSFKLSQITEEFCRETSCRFYFSTLWFTSLTKGSQYRSIYA